jgi:hypothetical protein
MPTPSTVTVPRLGQPSPGIAASSLGSEATDLDQGELLVQAAESGSQEGGGSPDEDLGMLQVRPQDADLGGIQIRPAPLEPPSPGKPKSLYLLGRLDYFYSSNVYSATDLIGDGFIRTGLSLYYAPALRPSTYFIGSINANLVRYGTFSDLNYNEWLIRAALSQQMTSRMWGQIGWSTQRLFAAPAGFQDIFVGENFFSDNNLFLEVSRTDPLGPRFSLYTFYQLRWSQANRLINDRMLNTFFSSLSYQLSPSWSSAIDFLFYWSHYTNQSRDDLVYQLLARTTYNITPNVQFNLFGGGSLGGSSDNADGFGANGTSQLDFNSWLFGVNLVFNVPLF